MQVGWEQGPTQLSVSALGFRGKAASEREIAGRLSHPIGEQSEAILLPTAGRSQKPFRLAAFCVQISAVSCWLSLPPPQWAVCILTALIDGSS